MSVREIVTTAVEGSGAVLVCAGLGVLFGLGVALVAAGVLAVAAGFLAGGDW